LSAAAGFRLMRIIALSSHLRLIEGEYVRSGLQLNSLM
jgi:hypothetical protein